MIFKSFVSYILGAIGGVFLMTFITDGQAYIGIIIFLSLLLVSQFISIKIKKMMKNKYWKKITGKKWS